MKPGDSDHLLGFNGIDRNGLDRLCGRGNHLRAGGAESDLGDLGLPHGYGGLPPIAVSVPKLGPGCHRPASIHPSRFLFVRSALNLFLQVIQTVVIRAFIQLLSPSSGSANAHSQYGGQP